MNEDRLRKVTSAGSVHKLTLIAGIPHDKLSEVLRGVILPLNSKAQSLDISIEIKAQSKEGFDRTTLDSKVKETLHQIGAEVKEWNEE